MYRSSLGFGCTPALLLSRSPRPHSCLHDQLKSAPLLRRLQRDCADLEAQLAELRQRPEPAAGELEEAAALRAELGGAQQQLQVWHRQPLSAQRHQHGRGEACTACTVFLCGSPW